MTAISEQDQKRIRYIKSEQRIGEATEALQRAGFMLCELEIRSDGMVRLEGYFAGKSART